MPYQVAKAEFDTPELKALLNAGWEPFAVVSTPVTEEDYVTGSDGEAYLSHTWTATGQHIDMIWLRIRS